MLDGAWISGQHLQVAHNAESALRQERNVVGLDGAGVARFNGDSGLAAHDGGVIEIPGGGEILRTIVGDDDVVEAEDEGHLFGNSVLLGAAAEHPIGIRATAFVKVAAVEVDEVVTAVNDFFGYEVGGALGLRAIGFAGVETVHTFLVDRVDVGNFLLERREIDDRQDDYRAGELGWVKIK